MIIILAKVKQSVDFYFKVQQQKLIQNLNCKNINNFKHTGKIINKKFQEVKIYNILQQF
jgi:hypothetical protein